MRELASWSDGTAKSAILDFVARVTKEGGRDYVPPSERIATFDNDGTLWCEYPMQVQVFFLFDRIKEFVERDPTLRDVAVFKAFLGRDMKAIHALGKKGIMEIFFATHAGMSEEDFERTTRAWLATARHPKFGRLFPHCTFRPQVELLEFLRSNGFKTFIVSGGGIDLIRAFAETAYGIPPEQVIGSSVKTRMEVEGAHVDIMKLADLNCFDDREAKVQNIGLHIGRRPILAFGNSDGDLAMLRYVRSGTGARLALLLHHDDEVREASYDRDFKLSPLADALDGAEAYGLILVSVKRDWRSVFIDANRQDRASA